MELRDDGLTPWQRRIRKMTEEEREEFNRQNRERARHRYALNTSEMTVKEEREEFLRQNRERARVFRALETPKERNLRLDAAAKRRRKAYEQLSPQQLIQVREQDAQRHRLAYRLLQARRERRQKLKQRGLGKHRGRQRKLRQAPREAADNEGKSLVAARKEITGLHEEEPQWTRSTADQVSDEPVFFASNCVKTYSSRKKDGPVPTGSVPTPIIKTPETIPGGVESPGKRFACTFPDCNRTFPDEAELAIHTRKHNGEFKLTNRNSETWWYIESRSGEMPFECDYDTCWRSFKREGDLKRHKRVHEKDERFRCPLEGCGQNFTDELELKEHNCEQRVTLPVSRFAVASDSEDLNLNSEASEVDNVVFEEIPPQLMCEAQIKTEPEEYDEEVESDTMETKYLGDMYHFLDTEPNILQACVEDWMGNVRVKIEPT